jgi:hypothetical protein
MSKANEKKEVIEKIHKWLIEESIDSTKKEHPSYLDFQINIKEPNQSIISYKDKPDSIVFATFADFKRR